MFTGTDVENSVAICYTYLVCQPQLTSTLKDYIEILVIFGIFYHSYGTFVTDKAYEICTEKICYVEMSTVFV